VEHGLYGSDPGLSSDAVGPERVAGAGSPADPAVRLVDVSKLYGKVEAVASLDLTIERGELLTLLGPSGSGKSTVLRMIAGLIKPSSGTIWIEDEEVGARPTHRRNIAMVFQSLALFPHMDVFANIAFPLRMRRIGRQEISRRVREALAIVRLPDIESRAIHELSGGQQQRVAIARALVYEPQLLLLDEPFGALDRRLREEMQLEIVRIHREIDVTIVNVTHDQREALMLSDRVAVMRDGHLEQLATSEAVYRNPTTPFVASFLGDANLIEGTLRSDATGDRLETASGANFAVDTAPDHLVGRACAIVLKSEVVHVAPSTDRSSGLEHVPGVVRLAVFEGGARYYEIDVESLGMRFKVSRPASVDTETFPIGSAVTLSWNRSDAPIVPLDRGAGEAE
jgi:ABC-type Fe3+/spermidine/putrescine transport system ATPase subunit